MPKELTPEQQRILKKWAGFALSVQDACNLCAVSITFAQAMQELTHLASEIGEGTEWRNRHPISVLFSSKIESLTNSEGDGVFHHAYDEVKKLTGE